MNKTSQLILKVHAVFLMILPVVLTLAGFVGMNWGRGPFTWLHDIPMTMVGLMQAYLLMMLIGVSMWTGAHGERSWRWSVIAITAHCVPLLTIFALWNVLAAGGYLGITYYSYLIHGTWIVIEAISLGITSRQYRTINAAMTASH